MNRLRFWIVFGTVLLAAVGASATTTRTTTLVIQNQSNVVIDGYAISTTSGDCVEIVNSTNVTIKNSQIGPCGQNNSTNNSRGVFVLSSKSVTIQDSYIHVENLASVCGESHDGIQILNSPGPVTIQGNVVAFGGSNIHAWDSSGINVIGNFLLNPRGATSCSDPDNLAGNQFQAWADDATPNSNIFVSDNYTISSPTGYAFAGNGSDQIGVGVSNGVTLQYNWVNGAQGANACGVLADYKSNGAVLVGNIVSATTNCGVGVGSGTNPVITGNKVLILVGGASAAGVTVTNYYGAVPCGPTTVSSNIAYAHQSGGYVQGYYADGCSPRTLSGNTFDDGCSNPNCAAYNLLYPIATTNPPPLIPPEPKECVVTSPFSTQTSLPACGAGPPPPTPPTPAPTASLSASPSSVTNGHPTSVLSWSSSNATSCFGSGFTTTGLSGSVTVSPTVTTTYKVTCSGAGSAVASAKVVSHLH